MSTTTTELLTAAAAAAAEIEKAAAECGATHHAAQTSYGVEVEALVGGEWVEVGDLEDGAVVEAVRLFDCDGERGRTCRTVAAVETDKAAWINTLELAAQESE